MFRSFPCLLVFAACAPDIGITTKDDEPDPTEALISVEPDRIDFGLKTSLDVARQVVTVKNDGNSRLFVDDIALKSDLSFTLEEGSQPLPFDLEPGGTATFEVVFTPVEGGNLGGEITVSSDATNEPELIVPVLGERAVPGLVVSPDPMVFGDRFIPCDTQQAFVLQNKGVEPLVISSMAFEGTTEQVSFSQGLPPLPLTLGKGETHVLPVAFVPSIPQTLAVEFVVDSNDLAGQVRVPITGSSRYVSEKTDTFVVPETNPVNILFAVDQSCSMDDQQAVLAASIQDFVGIFDAANVEVVLGVTTGGNGCFNRGILRTSSAGWKAAFTAAISEYPTGTADTEALLQAVTRSIQLDNPGQCNHGFRDGDAPLNVIYVSDESDQSSGWSSAPGYWASHLTALQAYAGAAPLRAHAIVDVNRSCGDDPNDPWAYVRVANATSGQVLNICSGGWASRFSTIATQAVADLKFYRLTTSGADPASVTVTIDGVPQTTGWVYDAARGGIVFDEVPPAASTIEVTYGTSPICP